AVALRVLDPVAEHRRLVLAGGHRLQQAGEAVAVEEVVPQDQRHAAAGQELLTDHERLRQPLGPRLLGVGEAHAPPRAVAEEGPGSGRSRGVERTRTSRTPASIRTLRG